MRHLASYLTGTLLFLAAPAYCADLVAEEPALPMAQEPLSYNWSGLYLGIAGGYLNPNFSVSSLNEDRSFGSDGFLIGGTVGYNVQFGHLVAGLEGDASYADADGHYNDLFGFGDGFGGKADIDYLATVRGRLGVALDRVLLYGTGGLALTDVEYKTELGDIDGKTRAGYTVGGGVEYAFTQNITSKVEYFYSDFGGKNKGFDAATIDTDFDLHAVRVGINYKF